MTTSRYEVLHSHETRKEVRTDGRTDVQPDFHGFMGYHISLGMDGPLARFSPWSSAIKFKLPVLYYFKTALRALDSISLLRYVLTTQMQFDFRFSSTARSVRRPNFALVIVFFR